MHRLLVSLLLAMSMAAFAQDDDSESAEDTETQVSEEVADEEDSDLDEQGYAEENEDDFEASDRVAADQSLAFPINRILCVELIKSRNIDDQTKYAILDHVDL